MQKKTKRWISALLSAVMLCTAVVPASVFAADDAAAEPGTLEIYDGAAPVPDEGFYLKESESKQLSVRYNGSETLPEGSSVVWDSVAPYAAYVDQNGLVTGRDASKRPVILAWIDSNIRPLWLIGPSLADSLTNTVNNTPGIDDPETMMSAFHLVLDPVLGENAANTLLNPLQSMINETKVEITATLVDAEGNTIASDNTWVGINKDDNFLASFIPNGTYITNHEAIPAVVEKGYQVKLNAITTPLRLNMGVDWEITELDPILGWIPISSDKATIDENNVITFLEPGTVTITASPDVQGLMDKIEEYLGTVGDIANAADGLKDLLVYMFGDSLTSGAIDLIIGIVQGIVNAGTGDDAQKMQEIVSQVANWVLQFTINDTVTVEIVDQLPVESFEIIGDTVDISTLQNETRKMTIGNIQPEGAVIGEDDVQWDCSDTNVAVVDPDGSLTVRGPYTFGKAAEFTIYATVDGVEESKGGWVRGDNTVNPTDVSITAERTQLEVGETVEYSAMVYPMALTAWDAVDNLRKYGVGLDMVGNGDINDVQWNTADNGILKIEGLQNIVRGESFKVTAVGGGTTTLFVRSARTNGIYDAIQITVHESVADLTIDQPDETIVEVDTTAGFGKGSVQLSATVTPDTATNKAVTWSSDSSKIKVDENGIVTYNVRPLVSPLPASANITATSVDNPAVSDTIRVTFTEAAVHVTGVTLGQSELAVNEGSTAQLTANVQPGDATVKDVTWVSSNPSVATVDANGLVTGLVPGDAVITVTTVDGSFTAQCAVSVRADKTALNGLSEKVEAKTDDLTAEEAAVLANAKAISAEELATQAEVDQAYTALLEVYGNHSDTNITSVSIIPTSAGDELSGEVIYHKTPWTKTWTSQTVELKVQINGGQDVEYKSIEWRAANWSIDDPEAKFDGATDGETVTVRPTFGVGPRSFWVQAVVYDMDGDAHASAPVKVRFYNWDWQK